VNCLDDHDVSIFSNGKKIVKSVDTIGKYGILLSILEQLGYLRRFDITYCENKKDECDKKMKKYGNRLIDGLCIYSKKFITIENDAEETNSTGGKYQKGKKTTHKYQKGKKTTRKYQKGKKTTRKNKRKQNHKVSYKRKSFL
jgi:hypothetical protein